MHFYSIQISSLKTPDIQSQRQQNHPLE